MKANPNKECDNQHYMLVCDFSTHIPCAKKCTQTQQLRDSATAYQFQLAFKVKTMTTAAAVATTSGADADTANQTESNWSKLKGPLLDAATKVSDLSKKQ